MPFGRWQTNWYCGKASRWYHDASMVVRVRFGQQTAVSDRRARKRGVAQALALLLKPAVLMASVLGCWRIGADLKWTSGFAISSGPFCYWQTWLGIALFLQVTSSMLGRYANRQTAAS